MPEFRFNYMDPKWLTPQTGQVTARDAEDALKNKIPNFLRKRGGKYIDHSMSEFKFSAWHKVQETHHYFSVV